MAHCDICEKIPTTGFNVSHSKRHTKRVWHPNAHKATIYVEGKAKQVMICTRCLRNQVKAK
jgi:large subunit ribosomal protein L28